MQRRRVFFVVRISALCRTDVSPNTSASPKQLLEQLEDHEGGGGGEAENEKMSFENKSETMNPASQSWRYICWGGGM
jgi:hypothetical protein